MDPLQSLAALLVPLPALIAAGLWASELPRRSAAARRIAAALPLVSSLSALAGLARILSGNADGLAALDLGTWLDSGPNHWLRLAFGLRLDVLNALTAASMSYSAFWISSWRPPDEPDAAPDERTEMAASLLLFASLMVVLSTTLGELLVFWQLGSIAAYLVLSADGDGGSRAVAARSAVLTLRLADACLLLGFLALIAGAHSAGADAFIGDAGSLHGEPSAANVVGLCLLGAAVGRCGLFPLLGLTDHLGSAQRRTAALLVAVCLMPTGVVLLARCADLLQAGRSLSSLAAFIGGTSAFCSGVCAAASRDRGRAAAFACASVFGMLLLGLAAGSSPDVAIRVLIVFMPASAVILGRASLRSTHRMTWAVAFCVAILFVGVAGQGALAVSSWQAARGHGGSGRWLGAILGLAGMFYAAFGAAGLFRARRSDTNSAGRMIVDVDRDSDSFDRSERRACAALAVGAAALLMLAGRLTSSETAHSTADRLGWVGCLPGVLGIGVAWRTFGDASPRTWPLTGGVLMRLGRGRFYCDSLLFLCVLMPIRGMAQLARFVDWFLIDAFFIGTPEGLVASTAGAFASVQGRRVAFYVAAAVGGAALLAGMIVWLRG